MIWIYAIVSVVAFAAGVFSCSLTLTGSGVLKGLSISEKIIEKMNEVQP